MDSFTAGILLIIGGVWVYFKLRHEIRTEREQDSEPDWEKELYN